MTYRAHVVRESYPSMELIVGIARPYADGRHEFVTGIVRSDADSLAGTPTEVVPEGVEGPLLRIPEDVARALLDALAQHFGGTSNSRQLRQDYDAERARVDKLIDSMIGRA